MSQFGSPGVYVVEEPVTTRTIEGASTSISAFIGVLERGPVNKATFVTSFIDYQNKFCWKNGGFNNNSYMTYSIKGFFDNGGKKCYVVRTKKNQHPNARIATLDVEDYGKSVFNVHEWNSLTNGTANADNPIISHLMSMSQDSDGNLDWLGQSTINTVGNAKTFTSTTGDPQSSLILTLNEAHTSVSYTIGDQPHALAANGDPINPKIILSTAPWNDLEDGDTIPTNPIITHLMSRHPDDLDWLGQSTINTVGNAKTFTSTTGDPQSSLILTLNEAHTSVSYTIGDQPHALAANGDPINPRIFLLLARNPFRIFAGIYWKNDSGKEQFGEEGSWGNDLYIVITDGGRNPAQEFAINVLRGNTILETFDDLSVVKGSNNYYVDIVNKSSSYICVKDLNPIVSAGFMISGPNPSLQASAQIGGDENSTTPRIFEIKIDNSDFFEVDLRTDETDLSTIAQLIQDSVRQQATKPGQPSTTFDALQNFICEYNTQGSSRFYLASGSNSVFSSIEIRAKKGNVLSKPVLESLKFELNTTDLSKGAMQGGRIKGPKKGTYQLGRNGLIQVDDDEMYFNTVVSHGMSESPTDNPFIYQPSDFIDSMKSLDKIDDVSIVMCPGNGGGQDREADEDIADQIISGGINYCKNRFLGDCIFIGDFPQLADTPAESVDFVSHMSIKNDHGVVYFPWVESPDPNGSGKNPSIIIPPSGHMAGVIAKIDGQRGVWKAPAGLETNIANILGLKINVSKEEHDLLNPKAINVIRNFPAYGNKVWGARTLSNDINWRYISVRRMANFLKVSIYKGVQWAVFEPNDEGLWSNLRLSIGSFMMDLFNQGAFQGKTPSEAFFVKCDKDTNPQINIDKGIVTVLVGFAPLKPAEFVLVKISQKLATSS